MSPGARDDGWWWPVLHVVDTTMTPRQAWDAWLAGKIDAAEFGAVLHAWEEVWR